MPQIRVPTATLHTIGERNPDAPRARCDMVGPQLDCTAQELAALYGDHRGYMRQLTRELRALEASGWSLPLYRKEILATAEALAGQFE